MVAIIDDRKRIWRLPIGRVKLADPYAASCRADTDALPAHKCPPWSNPRSAKTEAREVGSQVDQQQPDEEEPRIEQDHQIPSPSRRSFRR